MVIHENSTNQPTGKKVMSDTYVERTQGYVKQLGRRHEPSTIASMLKISPGTLQGSNRETPDFLKPDIIPVRTDLGRKRAYHDARLMARVRGEAQ